MTNDVFSLQNHLLIAMPNVHGSAFDRTVTLVCVNDKKGSFGITINRPMKVTVGDVFEQLKLNTAHEALKERMALLGGPVESGQGFVLHDSQRVWESTLRVSDALSVTSSRDILEAIALDDGPENFLLALGCANWAPQQLENELMENAWLTCPVKNDIIFDLPYKERWKAAADSMGVDLSRMSSGVGHA